MPDKRKAEIREKAEMLMLNMAALYVQARDAEELSEDLMPAMERIEAALEEALSAIPPSATGIFEGMPESIDGEEIERLLAAAERDFKISQAIGKGPI